MKTLLASLATLAFAPALHAADARPRSVGFETEVRIDVGADGRVVDVGMDEKLPAVLHAPVRTHVAGWVFEAPKRNGVAVGGTTYAYLSGCAVDSSSGVSIAFSPAKNGPGHGTRGMVGTSRFPLDRIPEPGRYVVTADYVVQPTGRVSVEAVRTESPRNGSARSLEQAVSKWLRERRFLPEQVDGQPVATRMSLPITYTFGAAPSAQAKADDAACTAAAAGRSDNEAVALDSPFRRQPAG